MEIYKNTYILPERIIFIVLLILSTSLETQAQTSHPKREMRAIWVATVDNIDWPSRPGLPVKEQQQELINLLEFHRKNGMNAIVFQIRPACDALYSSRHEPWSQWLTGTQGLAPDPFYDPLEFIIKECHERCIEVHTWLNPYRAVFDYETIQIDTTHVAYKHPDWILAYGKHKYLNPGLPETRDYVTEVITDVVSRYDIDAVHMDDYFYPYKIRDQEFPDDDSFNKYPRGFSPDQKENWRRDNVDLIIKQLHDSIKFHKPWIKFGISPFGVWRNKFVDPRGSDTKAGQTNYDDLYADILKWLENGWIDYVTPQVYWHIGFEVADYQEIVNWWGKNVFGKNLYVGHGAYRLNRKSKTKEWRSSDQIIKQIKLNRSIPNVSGSFFFSSRSFKKNPAGLNRKLRKDCYRYPALVPVNPALDGNQPSSPLDVKIIRNKRKFFMKWNHPENNADGTYFVVYRFKGEESGSIDNPENIYRITAKPQITIRKRCLLFRTNFTFVVTTVSRLHYESQPSEDITLKY